MAQNSKIEWTDHTFNPWWGCTKVSEACKHCYAEAWAKRVGQNVWGPKNNRRFFGEKHWNEPLKWNAKLEGQNKRERVFCASMADVFEDNRQLDKYREKLWQLIEDTPNLDWLLLTKRPDKVLGLEPWGNRWPSNVWLGTTVENQQRADENLPFLLATHARVKFISAEPLLGPIDLKQTIESLDWVISGGESGPNARPASPSWFRDLMLQCMQSEVPFHFKQWGDWAPGDGENLAKHRSKVAMDGTLMFRVGKKRAGRKLDGKLFDQLPNQPKAVASS